MLCALVKMLNFVLFSKCSHKSERLASLFGVCLMFCRRNVDSKDWSSAFFASLSRAKLNGSLGSHVFLSVCRPFILHWSGETGQNVLAFFCVVAFSPLMTFVKGSTSFNVFLCFYELLKYFSFGRCPRGEKGPSFCIPTRFTGSLFLLAVSSQHVFPFMSSILSLLLNLLA